MGNNTLYHYGIKGMRWGHRKGPRIKTSNTGKKYKDDNNTGDYKREKRMSHKQKRQRFLLLAGFSVAYLTLRNGNKKVKSIMNDIGHNNIHQHRQSMMENEATRQAINASLQSASLSMSGGTNPFMFGMF